MKILVTGGTGYIGSHVCVELLERGYEVVIIDNLVNSRKEVLDKVWKIAGKNLPLWTADLLDRAALDKLFTHHRFEAVMHFAALKAPGQSVADPLSYYHNNVTGTILLCEAMKVHGVKNLVFSSSAAVYGNPKRVPIVEDSPCNPISPYGRSKLVVEHVLRDLHGSDSKWNVIMLRYFNPVGAHCSGLIGEDPRGTPNNLVPYIAQVATGKLPELLVFGNDYPTKDGTGVRDYIHIHDLAMGHIKALEKLLQNPGLRIYNLGTGRPYSVLEVLEAFERACGNSIPYRVVERRPGDIAVSYADPTRAETQMDWVALKDIDSMCQGHWRWQSMNPNGFEGDVNGA